MAGFWTGQKSNFSLTLTFSIAVSLGSVWWRLIPGKKFSRTRVKKSDITLKCKFKKWYSGRDSGRDGRRTEPGGSHTLATPVT